jgi:colanic acid/amylovoran biosynthesis glycosyltransferase
VSGSVRASKPRSRNGARLSDDRHWLFRYRASSMTVRRIAYVVQVFPKLSETFIAGELVELRRRGIEIRILSILAPTERLRHEFIARARLDELTVYGPANFHSVLKEFRPEFLHAHFATEPAAAARVLASEFGLPFTFTAHGRDIYRQAPPDFAERVAAAAALVTVSEANARHIAANFAIPRDRIKVIPCGVDTELFHREHRMSAVEDRARSRGETLPLIVCVARLAPAKNLALLLRACANLRDRGVRFRCVLVGDGRCRVDLERTRERLGLEQLVEMAGAAEQTEVLGWWRRASIAALSSDSEGMPVSLMEAAACGVPAVATRVGGIPELIEHEVTGLLTPSGDAPALADALERLLANPRWAAEMGAAARRHVEKRFSLKLQIDRLLTLWRRI